MTNESPQRCRDVSVERLADAATTDRVQKSNSTNHLNRSPHQNKGLKPLIFYHLVN
ncbi:MAG: hypothetical protein LH702_17770 [Phormidesmis sp. CAN_BIN44]|nr:hypothetical protein [Phormidesmis sp. CAN_BIN44]